MSTYPSIFGVRHLSPACAYHLKEYLDKTQPLAVLVEGFCDASEYICHFAAASPPFAVLAYTEEPPVRSVLLPFAQYSPEYVAVRWALEHNALCEFIDLPSEVFFALTEQGAEAGGEEKDDMSIYEKIAELAGHEDYNSFWEHTYEHQPDTVVFMDAMTQFGLTIRALAFEDKERAAETLVREAFMRRRVKEVMDRGYRADEIVTVTGAYHIKALNKAFPPMSDQEYTRLPKIKSKVTLMPYSYFRLSSFSGYGAGNMAPEYFHNLHEMICRKSMNEISYHYLSAIAGYMRGKGLQGSTAQVIDAAALADTLSKLHNGSFPSLRDLKDAATVCLGNGEYSKIAEACAYFEVGTRIGELPAGVSRTSIQDDFYRELKRLKLDKYKSVIAEDLDLDLRENRKVKGEAAAFIDLNRSFFLHRLRVLNIPFQQIQQYHQNKANWAEKWILRWSPEAEIALVESILKGETIEIAAAYIFKERIEKAAQMSEASEVIRDACLCGMPKWMDGAVFCVGELSAQTGAFADIAGTIQNISATVTYGDIRQFDIEPLKPLLAKLFVKACLSVYDSSKCDDSASNEVIGGMGILNAVSRERHDFLEVDLWSETIKELAGRDDIHSKISGYACALQLSNNQMDNTELEQHVSRRLSPGMPPDLGSGWFEGLCLGNRYALLSRLVLWESIEKYIASLDEAQFKRALVFLRRALGGFENTEKAVICDNLTELWGVSYLDTGDVLNRELTEEEQKILDDLKDFNFDDI